MLPRVKKASGSGKIVALAKDTSGPNQVRAIKGKVFWIAGL
jgi:hypothetical protein